jgi:hypothetical protein
MNCARSILPCTVHLWPIKFTEIWFKHYNVNLKGSVVVNKMLVQEVPLCRPVHVVWALLFQMKLIHVTCCRLPHPFSTLPVSFAETTLNAAA